MKMVFALIGVATLALACGGDTSPFDATPTPTVLDATQAPADPSASPAPSCSPGIYTVQAEDTLLGIAIKFEVELRDVIAANADTIKDPNTLAIGQQIKVPCVQATPVPSTATPTPTTH